MKIGNIIGVSETRKLIELRILLASVAEDFLRTLEFTGGPTADSGKRKWRSKVINAATKLQSLLSDAERNSDTSAAIIDDGSRVRFYSTHHIVKGVLPSLNELVEQLQRLDQSSEESRDGTQHSLLMQHATNRATGVFIHFQGLENVKRSSDTEKIYGVYPDFIRAAVYPILIHFYPASERVPENLDNQTQVAVRAFRNSA
ncbi:MAG: hypothetical protein KDK08_00125 [Rhizobiaceae bacterium]|nr:hypothetical protein [Rhizobiaceae bacterium]